MQKTTQQLYDEAKSAYHSLLTGTLAQVIVDGQDGTRVEYAKADQARLYAYIQELAALLPVNPLAVSASRPAQFIF